MSNASRCLGVKLTVEYDITNADIIYKWYDRYARTLWGVSGIVLKKSIDSGTTWTTVHTFTGIVSISRMMVTCAGTILCVVDVADQDVRIARSVNGNDWEYVYQWQHNTAPLNGMTEHPSLGIFVGEYMEDDAAEIVTIINSTDDGVTFSVVKQWDHYSSYTGMGDTSGDHIRHVHMVRYDKHSGLIWVATGDDDSQCRLYTYDGTNWEIIASGNQSCRFVSSVFLNNCVIFPCDAAFLGSVSRYDRKTEAFDVLGKVNPDNKMDNLCWWATENSGASGVIFTQPHGESENASRNNIIVYNAGDDFIVEVARFSGVLGASLHVSVSNPMADERYIYTNFINTTLAGEGEHFVRLKTTKQILQAL